MKTGLGAVVQVSPSLGLAPPHPPPRDPHLKLLYAAEESLKETSEMNHGLCWLTEFK